MKTFYLCFIICFLQRVCSLTEPECEDDWYQFDDKCFKYHNDLAGANFHDAVTICDHTYKATPVTIHSEEESEFLTKMVYEKKHAKYSVWIGLLRANNQSFVWFDRSSLNYTNWGPNEPNNWHSKNYCTVMSSASTAKGKWFDVGCTTTYLVICQKYLTKSTNDSNKSMADQINMELNIEDNSESLDSLTNDLNSIKTLGNVNIVLTILLFLLLIGSVLKYNYNFSFIRRYRRNSDFSSFGNTLDRSTVSDI